MICSMEWFKKLCTANKNNNNNNNKQKMKDFMEIVVVIRSPTAF